MENDYASRKVFDIVNLVLTATWYNINYQFYQETDNIIMRETTSSITAEIYMQHHKKNAISASQNPKKKFERTC